MDSLQPAPPSCDPAARKGIASSGAAPCDSSDVRIPRLVYHENAVIHRVAYIPANTITRPLSSMSTRCYLDVDTMQIHNVGPDSMQADPRHLPHTSVDLTQLQICMNDVLTSQTFLEELASEFLLREKIDLHRQRVAQFMSRGRVKTTPESKPMPRIVA